MFQDTYVLSLADVTPQLKKTEEVMGDMIQQGMKSLLVKKEDTCDRNKWR